MTGVAFLSLVRKLLTSRAAWGVSIALGFWLAIAWHGHNKYSEGRADGVTAQKATDDSISTIAAAAEAVAREAAAAQLQAARLELAEKDRALQVARQASAMYAGRYAQALESYEALKAAKVASGDTTMSPTERACETVAATCALTVEAKKVELAAAEGKLAVAERTVARQDSAAQLEPVRTRRAVTAGIAQDRATRREPSRVKWALSGAVVAALTTWLVAR